MNENLVRIMRAEHLLHQVCEDALSEYVAECGMRASGHGNRCNPVRNNASGPDILQGGN